ncbi:unnamed protein product [Phaeothamnion confervicola]
MDTQYHERRAVASEELRQRIAVFGAKVEKGRVFDLSNQDGPKEQLTKEILQPGLPGDLPPNGSVVRVHYIGKLENSNIFDSSRARKTPFEFTLGQRSVILGWDLGVATMQRGETCLLKITPDYGYGSAGAGGAIPPNSTLFFEVELLGWREPALIESWQWGALAVVVVLMVYLLLVSD